MGGYILHPHRVVDDPPRIAVIAPVAVDNLDLPFTDDIAHHRDVAVRHFGGVGQDQHRTGRGLLAAGIARFGLPPPGVGVAEQVYAGNLPRVGDALHRLRYHPPYRHGIGDWLRPRRRAPRQDQGGQQQHDKFKMTRHGKKLQRCDQQAHGGIDDRLQRADGDIALRHDFVVEIDAEENDLVCDP